jgi:hypothetical protein
MPNEAAGVGVDGGEAGEAGATTGIVGSVGPSGEAATESGSAEKCSGEWKR